MKQKITRTKYLFKADVLEVAHHRGHLVWGEGFCPGAFETIIHAPPNRLSAPQPVTKPEHESGERGVIVEHDSGVATGFENSPGFLQTAGSVGAVMHDAVGI